MAKLDRFSGARQQAGKSKGNTKPFRKGVVQKANYQFKASFTKNGVVSRSWVSSTITGSSGISSSRVLFPAAMVAGAGDQGFGPRTSNANLKFS